MHVETCQFVRASKLFKETSLIWDEFCDSKNNFPFNWGTNAKSLVRLKDIKKAIKFLKQDSALVGRVGRFYAEELHFQCDVVLDRITELDSRILIDLEN